jgi:SAM-dependent methyltransferase
MAATEETIFTKTPAERIAAIGHRAYVGGNDAELWYGIGRLQYQFLISRGLRPDQVFLDVACGALRLGQFLIPYLDPGKYIGIDMVQEVIDAGLAHEILPEIVAAKAPRFWVNGDFDLTGAPPFEVAIAQSLMTHLTLDDIAHCARRLHAAAAPGARFYFTYFEGSDTVNPTTGSDPHLCWYYGFDQIAAPFRSAGWQVSRIGAWNHPRGQMMALAEPV